LATINRFVSTEGLGMQLIFSAQRLIFTAVVKCDSTEMFMTEVVSSGQCMQILLLFL